MVTFILIRHGESTDNLHSVWAGWKDAPLSNHGISKALGDFFSDTQFVAIHTSDLKRACLTAQAILDCQDSKETPINLLTSHLLREQHFGVAEGKPYSKSRPDVVLRDLYAQGIYPSPRDRDGSFPEGESRNDLRRRADQAVDEILLPYVWQSAREGTTGVCVALISHGLLIKELIAALVGRDAEGKKTDLYYKGLRNTAWARMTVEVQGLSRGKKMAVDDINYPPLKVRLTDFDRQDHLKNVVRQQGGIGSSAHDPNQKDIRSFFAGGS
ncbi:phosphoglycerate mutase-like protein [Guyanagaster necrorhizus]|uniref:Phosphoglycerate mutase-like protein n=1 Tax=Guyanagaster necrorhizus TaxID=856835 RepID=A0A9P8AS88_9AGAR|nr:phosphoglycerate mutase-like protein [Guyanagaster necrorhizus MCA 3950]KAG7445731.1 phosphoglycerate mutase-like protein [Guyanagaster necrorhizus MCA 3950]